MASGSSSSHSVKVDMLVMYKECLHNHATDTAFGTVHDGCGLFEPTGPTGTPEAMICAACKCHRNFHRRLEVELPLCYINQPRNNPVQQQHAPNPAPGGPVIGVALPHPRVPFTAPGPSYGANVGTGTAGEGNQMENRGDALGRTRKKGITREQSERLRVIAESNNWKMFKEYSKEEVLHICSEIGIARTVLKSWISNHRRRRAAMNEEEEEEEEDDDD